MSIASLLLCHHCQLLQPVAPATSCLFYIFTIIFSFNCTFETAARPNWGKLVGPSFTFPDSPALFLDFLTRLLTHRPRVSASLELVGPEKLRPSDAGAPAQHTQVWESIWIARSTFPFLQYSEATDGGFLDLGPIPIDFFMLVSPVAPVWENRCGIVAGVYIYAL